MRRAFLAIACFLLAVAANAQPSGKRVYISVDLEGISGVNGDDQTSAGQPEYGRARKLMAEDANAAIRGAFDGGGKENSAAAYRSVSRDDSISQLHVYRGGRRVQGNRGRRTRHTQVCA